MKVDILGLDAAETEQWAFEMGLEAYRGRQIRHWLFKKLVVSFDQMTNLPKSLRSFLQENAKVMNLEELRRQRSRDGTEKVLFALEDRQLIESVLIPEKDHDTLCISSQAGCAMGCRFCLTARQGLKRNLRASEIAGQVINIKRSMKRPERLTNIVLMGMGEPLANYDQVLKALRNLIDGEGMNFSHRKITLSTCGLVPEMRRLGKDITTNLAVSLNASNDRTRDFLMPINKKYPLRDLISACKDFPLPNRRMITFEYIMINGINDEPRDALNLASILSGVSAKINLIPLNPQSTKGLVAPSIDKILRFQEILFDKNYTAILRKSRGVDIKAACGQLSGTEDPMD